MLLLSKTLTEHSSSMERHTDLFFSDDDVAHLGKGRIFLGNPLADADGESSLLHPFANHVLQSSELNVVARILPTSKQCQSIRERREHDELHRSRVEGVSCVTADSLPFVYDADSYANDEVGSLNKDQHQLGEASHIGYSVNSSESIAIKTIDKHDELKLTFNEKCNTIGLVGNKSRKRKLDHTDETRRTVALDRSESGEGSCMDKKVAKSTSKDSYTSKKNSYDLYSDQSEGNSDDSSEEGMSNELISSDEEELDLGVDTCKEANETNTCPAKAISAAAASKSQNNSLRTSSEAIGSSIIKSIPDDSRWHNRRSEMEASLSRIKRKTQRNLLKRQSRRRRTTPVTARSPEDDAPGGGLDREAVQERSRTKLRFAAAPAAVNKRKKQMTLKSMFTK